MARRSKMSRKSSRRNFARGAAYTHKFNLSSNPMRGGIRL